MPTTPLPNYLIANRKRLSLSQREVAFLLGVQSSAKVSRDERFVRETSLATALAYEVIYRRSVSELFDGLYRQVEGEIAVRAKTLAQRKKPGKKRQMSGSITATQSNQSNN